VKIRTDHVTVLVIRPAGRSFEFLQLRRSAEDYLGGTWQTVRGSAEPGETSAQTALRELKEETGLTPVEFYTLGICENCYIAPADTLFHSPTFVALVNLNDAVILDREHDAFRWISRQEVADQFMWPSEAPLLQAVCQILDNGPAKAHLRLHP